MNMVFTTLPAYYAEQDLCPFVCLPDKSNGGCGFAGERHTGRRYRSIVAGAVLQAAALSSKCG